MTWQKHTVRGIIIVTGTNTAITRNKKLTFENNAPFWPCISKVNNTLVDNVEDLDIVDSMYNVSEVIILWHQEVCDRFEVNDSANEKNNTSNYRKNSNKTTTSKAFGYKTKIIGSCCYIKVFK